MYLRGGWGDVVCCLDPSESTDFHRFIMQGVFTDQQPRYTLPPAWDSDGNMFGAMEFYKACNAVGVKPIIGMEAYLAPASRFDKEQRMGDAQCDILEGRPSLGSARAVWAAVMLLFMTLGVWLARELLEGAR